MANSITYGCTALVGTNKAGILKPDSSGRYDMILGALEFPNSVGDIYTLSSAKAFFEKGSSLMRRIQNGQLRSEYGHPKMLPGMTEDSYLNRILTIDEANVCAHLTDIKIDYENVRDPKTGKKIIAIRGRVKPSGPLGQTLKDILDDPEQNCAFSIRSLTMNRQVGFRQEKDFTQIVTWDYVNEPGLSIANKYAVPTLEHMGHDHQFDRTQFTNLAKAVSRQPVSLESAQLLKELVDNINNGTTPSYIKKW